MSLTVHLVPDHETGCDVLQVGGEIDLATVAELERGIQSIQPSDYAVVIDLTATEFMDSNGLRLLTAAQERFASEGRRLRIVVAEGAVKRVLEVTDLLGDFDVYPTLADALL